MPESEVTANNSKSEMKDKLDKSPATYDDTDAVFWMWLFAESMLAVAAAIFIDKARGIRTK